MYSAAVLVALVGSAAAQTAPSYGSASNITACPEVGTTGSDGRYGCNPAHSYPTGQVCELADGCYYLRTITPGVSVDVGTALSRTATASVDVGTAVSRTATAYATSSSAACPAVGTSGSDGRYSCNPAHSYPTGQVCELADGCYYLRTITPGVSVDVGTALSRTVDVGTALSRTATVSVDVGTALSRTVDVGTALSRTLPATVVYRTTTVSELTTYCPEPTTFSHSGVPSTVVVTRATTLTVPCPSGCVVTTPETRPATTVPVTPETRPATSVPVTTGATTAPPPQYRPTGSASTLTASRNATASHSIVTYTGAGALATGAPLAAMAALGAFLL